MTIGEFLEARIAEDEAEAEKGGYHNASGGVFARDNYGCLLVQPSRVLAESTAKRAIIKQHEAKRDFVYEAGEFALCSMCTETGPNAQGWPCGTIRALAAVYSDHPDYDKDWAL